jgi:hypothetical protein
MTTKTPSRFFLQTAWMLGAGHGHHWAATGPRAAWDAGDLAAFDAAMATFGAENPEDWGGVGRPASSPWEHETCTRRTSWVLDNERLTVTLRAEGSVTGGELWNGGVWQIGATIATLTLDALAPSILVAKVLDWPRWSKEGGYGDTGASRAWRLCKELEANLQLSDERAMGRALMESRR